METGKNIIILQKYVKNAVKWVGIYMQSIITAKLYSCGQEKITILLKRRQI